MDYDDDGRDDGPEGADNHDDGGENDCFDTGTENDFDGGIGDDLDTDAEDDFDGGIGDDLDTDAEDDFDGGIGDDLDANTEDDFDGGIGDDLDANTEEDFDGGIGDDLDTDAEDDPGDAGDDLNTDTKDIDSQVEQEHANQEHAGQEVIDLQETVPENVVLKEEDFNIKDAQIPVLEEHNELRDPTLSPEQLEILEDMERKGETEVAPTDLGPATRASSNSLVSADVHMKDNSEKASYTSDQLVGQAQRQEAGFSNMTVAQFLDNHQEYQEKGRSPEAAKEQHDYRTGLEETIKADVIAANPDITEDELKAEVKSEMGKGAALHDPDMRAGGFTSGVHGYGNAAANSSLGSQWAHGQADSLYEQVMEQVTKNEMTREEMEQTYLDVTIHIDKK